MDFDLECDVYYYCKRVNMPLSLDGMEIIRLSGYTEDEKGTIAFEHLIPRQKGARLKRDEIKVTEQAVTDIIRFYTREAECAHWNVKSQKLLVKRLLKL